MKRRGGNEGRQGEGGRGSGRGSGSGSSGGGGAALSLFIALACATVWAAAFGGCASAPPESFYTLASGVREGGAHHPAFTRTVLVERAGLPESVDRPQLVTFLDANRVQILEQRRWAEPLRAGVSRVVADSLGRLVGSWQVSGREDAFITEPDCRVFLDLRRFEARLGSDVSLDVAWTVACAGAPRQVGRSLVRESAAPAPTEERFVALVAAEGRALDKVSADLARTLLMPVHPL